MRQQQKDTELVRASRDGDKQAFAALVERYRETIFFLVRRIVGSDEEAGETTQDVFIKVYRHLDRFDGRASFSTWLYRIACNTALSAVRRHVRQPLPISERMLASLPDEAVDSLFAEEENERRVAALHRAIGALAPDERALITLFYFEERSLAECAVILGVTENNAKVRLHRIRKKLYLLIQQQSDEC